MIHKKNSLSSLRRIVGCHDLRPNGFETRLHNAVSPTFFDSFSNILDLNQVVI